jgi:glycosyltransferase involved in cell wall biosynthesis
MRRSGRSTRLCLASPSLFPAYGGVQLRFLRYLPGFLERGIETRVLTGTPTQKEIAGTPIEPDWRAQPPGARLDPQAIDGTPAYRVRLPDRTGWRRTIIYNQTLVKCCREPESRPDVLQMLNNLRPRVIPWLMRLRAMGIPLVYALTIAPTNRSRKPHKRILWKSNLRRLYNQLDCLIANNSPLRDMVRELGVTTRIEVIPNGIDLARFHPETGGADRHRLREALGIGASDPVICAVGAVIPRKGGDMLLEAWVRIIARFPRAHVLFVGPQTHLEHARLADFRQRLDALGRASGVPGQVHFTGIVDDVEAYLRASDVLVLASEREGLPNSVLEAMATSLPVIVTPYIGLSSDIGIADQHYLLSEPHAEALAARLAELLASPERRLEQGQRGRRWVEETMALERSLDRYADLYHELAG